MKKAALHNLGCKVNAYETEAMQQMLEEAGYEIVPFREKADLYVINTCSVTNIADRKSRQMLHRARKQNPDAVIAAAGCYVQAQGPQMQEEGIADIILGNNKKKHLISMIKEYEKIRAASAAEAENASRIQEESAGKDNSSGKPKTAAAGAENVSQSRETTAGAENVSGIQEESAGKDNSSGKPKTSAAGAENVSQSRETAAAESVSAIQTEEADNSSGKPKTAAAGTDSGNRQHAESATESSIKQSCGNCRQPASAEENQRPHRHTVLDWEDLNNGIKEYEPLSVTRTAEHTRAFIKIQDGCNQFCSYCIIPYTRGRVRSRQEGEILKEIDTLAKGGCKETVLTGIHLSSYGTDFGCGQGEGLLRLLGRIHEIEGIRRIRLGSLEPGIITEQFAKELAGMEKICPHFHLSLQSGCDSVLKRMNRRYTTAEYAMRCEILRNFFENPAITTDVIAGFPAETEEEFLKTRQFLEQMQFYEMHIFKYSKRQGTRAAAMDGQIPEAVKAERSAQLILLGEQMSARYREGFTGKISEALLEEPFSYNGKQYVTGYTKEYVKIAAETGNSRVNSFIKGKITGQLTDEIYLMVEF